MSIQWYPGHMVKAKHLVQENLKIVDLVVELLDARVPLSSRNPDINELVSGKPRLILLNKADLADPSVTKQWQQWFEQQQQQLKAIPVSSTTGLGLNRIPAVAEELAKGAMAKWVAKGRMLRAVRMMVVGIPNVGKSSLINRLAGGKKAETGNKPGVTRRKQWVRLRDDLDLLDMPGILMPRFDDQEVGLRLAATGAISDDVYDQETAVKWFLGWLVANYPQNLAERYKLIGPLPTDGEQLLESIARKRGCLLAGGSVDHLRAARLVFDEFRSGKMGLISLEKPVSAETP